MRMPLRPLRLLVCAALALMAPRAFADQASTLKQQGLKAAQDKNWEVARERFEQSYALDPRPLTLFNLAVAQEHTGKLLAARESYAAFLEQAPPGEHETFRKIARDAIPTLDKAIPTLRVRVTGLAASDVVEVDGHDATIDAPIALDPGSHTVAVRRGREALAQKTVALTRGRRDEVELTVPVVPVVPAVPPRVEPRPEPARLSFEQPTPAPGPREPSSLLRSRWFWGITAAVVLVGAGASYYYLTAPTADPTRGTLGPGVLPVP
jgi:hypothetical protein